MTNIQKNILYDIYIYTYKSNKWEKLSDIPTRMVMKFCECLVWWHNIDSNAELAGRRKFIASVILGAILLS